MQQLRAASITAGGLGAVAWVQHVVRPLLCPPRGLGQAYASPARGPAGRDHETARPAYTGGCFAGLAGTACGLSVEEQVIAVRVHGEPRSWEDGLMDYMQEANAIAVQLRRAGAARAVGVRRGGAKPAAAASALQREVLAFMREFLADEDQLPPLSCLALRFDMTASGIDWHVQQLVRRGHLERNAVGKLRFARKGGM